MPETEEKRERKGRDPRPVPERMLEHINPKFTAWLDEQTPETAAAIAAKWEETGAHEDIAHGTHSGHHARQRRLLEYCAEAFSYEFS